MTEETHRLPTTSKQSANQEWLGLQKFLPSGLLLAVSLLIAASTCAIAAYAILRNLDQEREIAAARLIAISDLKADQISFWIKEREGDALYANGPYIQSLASAWIQNKDGTALVNLLQRSNDMKRYYGYEGVYFFDGEGQFLHGYANKKDIDPVLKKALAQAIASNTITHIGPYIHHNEEVYLDFVSPLSIADNQRRAAIVLRFDARTFLFHTLSAWPYPSQSGNSFLLQKDGDHIVYLNKIEKNGDVLTAFRLSLSSEGPVSARVLRNPAMLGMVLEGVDYDGAPVLGLVQKIEGIDWFLLSQISLAEINAAAWHKAIWIVLFGALALAINFGTALFFKQRQIMMKTLRDANTEQEAVFNAANIGIILTQDGNVVSHNRKMVDIFRLAPEELTGKTTEILFADASDYNSSQTDFAEQTPISDVYRHERLMRRRDGSLFWCRHMMQSIDKDDPKRGCAETFEDISLEKLAQSQADTARAKAEEAATLKANFLANMSHEIRTPMNAVIGMTYLALKAEPEPRIRDYLQKINASSHHLLGIINDILDFSKIEAGHMPIEKISIDLEELLENVTGLISEQANVKSIEVIIDIDDSVPRNLIGDPLRIRQVLANYLNNAVKFTNQGDIIVRVRLVERIKDSIILKFSVIDSGIGIPETRREQLFSAFEQLDASTTRNYGGTGLGLAIAKRLSEAMGGGVGVESVVGEGSIFWFTAKLGVGESQKPRTLIAPNLRGKRVLLADDREEARQILGGLLHSFGFDVLPVSSGFEALRMIQTADTEGVSYDILILDWKMPGMDGVSVLERIRDMHLKQPPSILMVTAYDRDELAGVVEHLQISDILVKPVTPSTLFDSITRILTPRSARDKGLMREIDGPLSGAHEDEARWTLSGARALLVEDNELNQEVASEILKAFGMVVDVAVNGAVAVEMVKRGIYDIILMDVQMPVMDGLEATSLIRQDPKFADIPILAMTASVMAEDQQGCLAVGMNDHIAKPIDPSFLESSLIKWLANHVISRTKPIPVVEKLQTLGSEELFSEPIAGLEIEVGLHRSLGRRDLYCSLLRKFVHRERDAATNIANAIASGEMLEAERLAHTLKGGAGNIGAHKVQEVATELESAIRERRSQPELEHYCDTLHKLLDDLIRAIEQRLPVVVEKAMEEIDAEKLALVCQKLARALAESETYASDIFIENSQLLASAFPTHHPLLEKQIEAYDYEAAAITLRDAQISMNRHG